MASDLTVVHLLRHGEVHNPEGVLYGRLPGYHLSELGRRMAEAVRDHLHTHDIVMVGASPLERAIETARPVADDRGLGIHVDGRLVEAGNVFEGKAVGAGLGIVTQVPHWPALRNPFTPSWGEAYRGIAARMLAAVESAREQALGHEALLVSHQLPIWTLRSHLQGRRLWHDPRRRECALASLTSLHYVDGRLDSITYTEPAAELVAQARSGAGA